MSIIQCLENNNVECIKDWAINGFLWYLIGTVIIIGLFFRSSLDLIRAFRLSGTILSRNRSAKGRGFGKKRADVFMDLWFSERNYNNIVSECISNGNQTNQKRTQIGEIVERELQPFELAEVFNSNNERKVRVIKNFRNRLVFYFTKFYLVHFIGDDPKSYK